MFDRESTRLTRIDWMKYGLSALNPSSGQEPTNEQLKQAIVGMATGFNQFAQELSQLLGGHDIGVKHRAPVALIGYEPDAPGINDDTEIEDTYPRLMSWSGDSYYDPDDGYAKGGLAGLFQGVVIMRPNVANVNVNIGNAQHKIVMWGQNGAGLKFENIYVENLLDMDGNAYVTSSMPTGSVMLWAGSIGSIPTGWALMDGTANVTGSGIDMRGQVPYGYSGAGDFATIGATIAIALATSFSGSSTSSVTIANAVTGITVSAHDDNNSTFPTTNVGSTLTVAPTNASLATGADFDALIWLQVDGTPAVTAHSHNVDEDEISAALTNHTITEPNAGAGHSHTGTVSNSTIASSLTINTPSTVRSPGKVLAFIEKIA